MPFIEAMKRNSGDESVLKLCLKTAFLTALVVESAAMAQNASGPPPIFHSAPVTQTRDMFLSKTSISAAGAQRIIDAVTAEAERQHNAVTVVVVDEGGSLVAMKRMDGANLGSLQAAMAKAVTALKLELPTGTFLQDGQPNMPVATAFISAGFTLLAGGQPIHVKNGVVGAVAVSGTGDDKAYIRLAMQAIGL